MNNANKKYEGIERLLRQAQPSNTPAEAKARITEAARNAWGQARQEIPWQVPVRRLAISAVAAALVVSLANIAGSSVTPGADRTERPNMSRVYEAEYGNIISAASIRSYETLGAIRLSERLRLIGELLEETEPGDKSTQPAPEPPRSRLVPTTRPEQLWS